MIFCEDCRVRNNYPRNPGYPFIGLKSDAQCEICRRWRECHDVNKKDIFEPETKYEKHVDSIRQMLYRMKCDNLKAYFYSGPRRGEIDEQATELFKRAFRYKNGEVDWVATYEIRAAAVQGHKLKQEGK